MLRRVLIANRGEIALRILRACRELGIETVAVYSQADEEALPVQLATRSLCIGPAKAADSYLNQDALLTVAKAAGCDAVHPGYGFLSENADFSDACTAAGLTFIGPSGDAIRRAGSKSAAKTRMKQAGVPVTPGSDGPVDSVEAARDAAKAVGYPVLLKASAGGGGRGIRRVYREEELQEAFESAQAEAIACFGSGEMYLEKLILRPRHIEVQILADRHGHVISLGDRDCSVQRRNQKLLEEAPAWGLSPALREEMGQAAVRAAQAVGYESAGTVEFLLDPDGSHFYFMEMNTRIQCGSGAGAAADCLRPPPIHHPRGRAYHWSCHRVPRQRRGPRGGFPSLPRYRGVFALPRRTRCPGGFLSLYRLPAATLVRLHGSEAHGSRTHPAGGHPEDAALPGRIYSGGLPHQRGAVLPDFVSPGLYPGLLYHSIFR